MCKRQLENKTVYNEAFNWGGGTASSSSDINQRVRQGGLISFQKYDLYKSGGSGHI